MVIFLTAVFDRNARKMFVLPTYGTYPLHALYISYIGVYVMCLYLDMALKRYGHIKVLPTLENSPAFLQHLLFKEEKFNIS